MIFSDVYKKLIENKEKRERGEIIAIPFPLPNISRYLPGVEQGRYIITTASPKVGKSKITDFLFLYSPIEYLIKHPECNIDLKIMYFTLEMSKEDKIQEAICYKLFRDTGKSYSSVDISSVFDHYILEDDIAKHIGGQSDYFKYYEDVVTYIDGIGNSYGIYKYIRDYAHENGIYIDKDFNQLDTDKIEKGDIDEITQIYKYVPNNLNEYLIIIVDHVSLLTPEKGEGLHSAILNFSSNVARRARNRWGYTIVAVQQQAAAQEGIQHVLANKLRPNASGLADCKYTSRDCDIMLGLFSPFRHEKKAWNGYDITELKDSYRELSIILNRRGPAKFTDLYFNGQAGFFEELPDPDSAEFKKYII